MIRLEFLAVHKEFLMDTIASALTGSSFFMLHLLAVREIN